MEIQKYDFDNSVTLINLGDIHRGSFYCNTALLNRAIKFIETHPNVYWVSTGDLLDVALKDSVTGPYKSLPLAEEYRVMLKELEPIANKCLGLVASNHPARFERATGMSLDAFFAKDLMIPYLGKTGLVNINCCRARYFIAMHHGIGCGRMRGGKSNNLERLSNVVSGADVYLEGHTHTFEHFINDHQYIDHKACRLKVSKAHFVTTGHFLNYRGDYGEQKKFPPMPMGAALVELVKSDKPIPKKKIKVDLFQ